MTQGTAAPKLSPKSDGRERREEEEGVQNTWREGFYDRCEETPAERPCCTEECDGL